MKIFTPKVERRHCVASSKAILFGFFLLIFATCQGVTRAQSPGPLLLQYPTISRTKIAFSYTGDIWTVDRSGGTAQRLTTNPANEVYPTFSPDGFLP